MKKLKLLLLIVLITPVVLRAQGDLDELLKGSSENAKYLANGYISPALKAFGTGLNQGWYNTAKVHKFPGADITITVSQIKVPSADRFFEVDNAILGAGNPSSSIRLERAHNGSPVTATGKGLMPTMFGPDNTQAQLRVYNGPTPSPIPAQNGAPGIGIDFLAVPMAHIGIGLPKGFDIKFRYVPTIDLSNLSSDITGEFGLFGVGVMHDIKQYIPGIKELPFDLSAFVGYTSMKMDVGFNSSDPDQKGEFKSTATTIQGLISKKFSVLTIYGGVGYNIANTSLGVSGTYDIDDSPITPEAPLNFKIEGKASGPRATAGIRLKLAILTLHADYTLQEYNTLSAGIGLSVRN